MALTGWPLFDPLVAILVAKSFSPLMDGRLAGEEWKELTDLLDTFTGPEVGYHDLTETIEAALTRRWEHAEALIHMEPAEA